jgi:IclR family pca regulon transcriptional regulator
MKLAKRANSNIKGVLILESFTPGKPHLSQWEIQKATNISKSTVFRLVKTLTDLNYLKYDPGNRKYFLGPKVLSLGFSVLQSLEVREIARPYLEKLSRECNKSVNLLMLDGIEMVFVERIRVPGPRDYNVSIGSRIAVYNTAAGRAVLAYLGQEKFSAVIREIQGVPSAVRHIGQNGERLFQILSKVKREGFATNDEESAKGLRAIAVPILSSEGVACAIDLIVAPEEVSLKELRKEYAPRLVETGKEISEALGYRGAK